MKTKHAFLLFVGLIMISFSSVEAKEKKVDHNKTVTFEVSMSCVGCKNKIEKNIAFEKGIKDMQVDLSKKNVTLTFDSRKTDEEKIINAFEKLGYAAKPIESKNTL